MDRDNPVNRVFEPLVRVVAILSGYAVLGLAFLVAFEVLARKLFNFSTEGVDEIGGYVVAIMAAFGFTYALMQRAHTRIDIFLKYLPVSLQAWLHFAAMLTMSGFAGFMVWRAYATLVESIGYRSVSSTPLQTPLWLPQSLWVAGLALFALVSIAGAIHAFRLAIRDPRLALRYYGPPTLEEEIRNERQDMAGIDEPQRDSAR